MLVYMQYIDIHIKMSHNVEFTANVPYDLDPSLVDVLKQKGFTIIVSNRDNIMLYNNLHDPYTIAHIPKTNDELLTIINDVYKYDDKSEIMKIVNNEGYKSLCRSNEILLNKLYSYK